ncbi:MAG: Gfo/Idh/MocA family protein [Salinarimonas sp.]
MSGVGGMSGERKPFRRIRLGMVGGGRDAFIGGVHRIAARLDDRFTLVAGALSSDRVRARESGADLGLDPKRCYDDYRKMAQREGRLAGGIEAVAVVTPNHLHAAVAKEFLRRGIHVICDKPLTGTLREARGLAAAARESSARLIVTYNYSAYPMIRQARAMIRDGALGALRIVRAEYAQDWLAAPLEREGQKQASWRTDPARSGGGGAIGDIGTHAFQLIGFVTGLRVARLSADLDSFVPGRAVDDNAHIRLDFAEGARGTIWASQVAVGCENGLSLRIFGEKGALSWSQEEPNRLVHAPLGEAPRLITRGGAGAGPEAAAVTRVPAGHPEGYLEAFATLYREAADVILGAPTSGETLPGLADGYAGVAFVDACLRSARADGRWVVPVLDPP